mmetsp:Transcript_4449/g.7886  ORF Transcript_4449/g.7886 Transcript_4449/m.7886 type:complete len:289 (+) Transcript_4449:1455-2321(+)
MLGLGRGLGLGLEFHLGFGLGKGPGLGSGTAWGAAAVALGWTEGASVCHGAWVLPYARHGAAAAGSRLRRGWWGVGCARRPEGVLRVPSVKGDVGLAPRASGSGLTTVACVGELRGLGRRPGLRWVTLLGPSWGSLKGDAALPGVCGPDLSPRPVYPALAPAGEGAGEGRSPAARLGGVRCVALAAAAAALAGMREAGARLGVGGPKVAGPGGHFALGPRGRFVGVVWRGVVRFVGVDAVVWGPGGVFKERALRGVETLEPANNRGGVLAAEGAASSSSQHRDRLMLS